MLRWLHMTRRIVESLTSRASDFFPGRNNADASKPLGQSGPRRPNCHQPMSLKFSYSGRLNANFRTTSVH